MGHLERRPGDTYYRGGWWYADEDEYLDTVLEYSKREYHEDPLPDDDDEDEDDGYGRS